VQLKEKYENLLKNEDKEIDFPEPTEPYYKIANNKKKRSNDGRVITNEKRPRWSPDEIEQ
jgi:hypothetical protein